MNEYTATYSPEDNKLRLYAASRLDPETYARIKAAGFIWAPKQKLFVAPMWTPDREDILIELAGEIEDEDKSLVERQEERADRFDEYSDKRRDDAERAKNAVGAIADNIPFGQPILVGHHSERHARKDAERIENGMRKAIRMWETAEYWQRRAAGAIRHAKYKERPDVRARRIKTIEADKRKFERNRAKSEKLLKCYYDPTALDAKLSDGRELIPALLMSYQGGISFEDSRALETGKIDLETALGKAIRNCRRNVAWCNRWINHFENRLIYEKAMLDEQGAGHLLQPKPKPEQLPLVNYKAPDGVKVKALYGRGEFETLPQVEMTKAEYAKVWNDYKGTRIVENSHRIRTAMIRKPGQQYGLNHVCVFLTDSKEHEKPAPLAAVPQPEMPIRDYTPAPKDPQAEEFKAMKETLKAGIQTVTAPQLFPTPPEIAARMVELAEIEPDHRVLEPSAGTGNIIKAIGSTPDKVAVEINPGLVNILMRCGVSGLHIHEGDFLQQNGNLGKFDRVIMNPPFENAADIKHIRHALTFLKPGGRLVALCANGPRQREAFREIAAHWEDLPPGSFKEQGTGVNVALMVLEAGS